MYTEELTHENLAERVETLESMKSYIEQMDKPSHLEILKILKKNPKIKLNENKSGVYVNLSFLSTETIEEIRQYIQYIKDQTNTINEIERKEEEILEKFFEKKDNKDNETYNISYPQIETDC